MGFNCGPYTTGGAINFVSKKVTTIPTKLMRLLYSRTFPEELGVLDFINLTNLLNNENI